MITIYTTDGIFKFNSVVEMVGFVDEGKALLHREDGPAVETTTQFKSTFSETYWLNGKMYSKDEFDRELLRLKMKII